MIAPVPLLPPLQLLLTTQFLPPPLAGRHSSVDDSTSPSSPLCPLSLPQLDCRRNSNPSSQAGRHSLIEDTPSPSSRPQPLHAPAHARQTLGRALPASTLKRWVSLFCLVSQGVTPLVMCRSNRLLGSRDELLWQGDDEARQLFWHGAEQILLSSLLRSNCSPVASPSVHAKCLPAIALTSGLRSATQVLGFGCRGCQRQTRSRSCSGSWCRSCRSSCVGKGMKAKARQGQVQCSLSHREHQGQRLSGSLPRSTLV